MPMVRTNDVRTAGFFVDFFARERFHGFKFSVIQF